MPQSTQQRLNYLFDALARTLVLTDDMVDGDSLIGQNECVLASLREIRSALHQATRAASLACYQCDNKPKLAVAK